MQLRQILANKIQVFVTDWYGVHHFKDWQDEPLEPSKTYYLIEFEKEHIDVVKFEDLHVYLDLPRGTQENKIMDCLDSYYLDWSIEVSTGEEEK
ncbi:MAG: hypothetical protein ABF624_00235 [Liquorilactobacillus ghanensis]|uniref:hypothetical protein n=1 Tax=Liquorilactobacillus ghanensis TaxID=399370 RepID=UPI0039E94D3D